MSGGGYLVAKQASMWGEVVDALVAIGAQNFASGSRDEEIQYNKDGQLFTIYAQMDDGDENDVRRGPFFAAAGIMLPSMSDVYACPFDCRWPQLTAHMFAAIASGASGPRWLLDGDGVVWDAAAVDPERVTL